MERRVLIVSNAADGHVAPVAARLRELDCGVSLIETDRIGEEGFVTIRVFPTGSGVVIRSPDGEQIVGADAVWYRRPRWPALESDDPNQTAFVRDQWVRTFEGVWTALGDCLWVSQPARLRDAECKPRQLAIAARLGMPIPDTVVTNDTAVIRDFVELHGGRTIVKPIGKAWFEEPDGSEWHILTNRLDAGQLDAVDSTAPMIVQEEVPKAYELRVNVIGRRVVAIRIDSQASPTSSLDWRRYDLANTAYSPYELPALVQQQCLEIVQHLGLEFSAIDLIRRRDDGAYVFLEANPNGQFLWAEELSGAAVSSAVARLLAGLDPPLSTRKQEVSP